MTIAAPATSSRQRLIESAAALFTTHGFQAVGLDQIIGVVGVTKTTFYKHFESKDALILAVLAFQHEVEMQRLTDDLQNLAGDDPRAQILAIFDVLDQWFAQSDFGGCMFLNAATEFPQATDPIHIAAEAHGKALVALVRERAIAAGANAVNADRFAAQIMVLISGAIIMRQTSHARDAALVARSTAQALLGQLSRAHG